MKPLSRGCETLNSPVDESRKSLNQKKSGTKTAPLGHRLTVRKTGPLEARFGATFQNSRLADLKKEAY